jgi:hypothetical protein
VRPHGKPDAAPACANICCATGRAHSRAAGRSWLDISTFEQLCRQSHSHIVRRQRRVDLRAADRLTPAICSRTFRLTTPTTPSTTGASRNAIIARHVLHVQRDAARIHRERQDFDRAGALPESARHRSLCEIAHEEAMRVFRAQGRREAIDRQYKLYRDSLRHFDDRPQSAWLRQVYRELADRG